jgi:hypothetical protein
MKEECRLHYEYVYNIDNVKVAVSILFFVRDCGRTTEKKHNIFFLTVSDIFIRLPGNTTN